MTSALFERLSLNASYLAAKQFIPPFVYGTAWKKEATSDLVYQALCNGFTAIDTANQPKHYREDLVGDGLRRAISEGKIQRSEVYLQTKFTSISGQDPNKTPYNPSSPVSEQVKASIESSLKHLRPSDDLESTASSYLEAVVLHSPLTTLDETMEAWHTLEQYVPQHIRVLGISNCPLFTLMDVYERSDIKPAVVQNRFYPSTKFDIGVRKFCRKNSIIYQSFWTLTANPRLLQSQEVQSLVKKLSISSQAALYGLVLALGNTVVLNGTKNQEHMIADFEALDAMQKYAADKPHDWANLVGCFQSAIGETSF